jgi:hypothetical protein
MTEPGALVTDDGAPFRGVESEINGKRPATGACSG